MAGDRILRKKDVSVGYFFSPTRIEALILSLIRGSFITQLLAVIIEVTAVGVCIGHA